MKYSKQGNWVKIISSPFTLVVIVVIFIFLIKAVWNMREKVISSSENLNTVSAELSRLENRQSDLADKIKYLSTEQGVESELRTKYRAIRDGESVAVIVDDNQTASVIDASSTDLIINEKKSWTRKFLQFFGF